MFDAILRELLSSTPGAIGAVFLDREGEAVQFGAERVFDIGPEGLKAVGAYQGIYLAELQRVCSRIAAGQPQRFTIEFESVRIMSCDLKDGYYLVLIVDRTANDGLAWHHLRSCRQKLLTEI